MPTKSVKKSKNGKEEGQDDPNVVDETTAHSEDNNNNNTPNNSDIAKTKGKTNTEKFPSVVFAIQYHNGEQQFFDYNEMNVKLHTLVPSNTIKYNKLCNSIEDAKMWLLEKNAVSSCVRVSPK